MNKKYKVEWAAVAESDLKQIIDYAATDSPSNALQIFKKIRQKVSNLYAFPERPDCSRTARSGNTHLQGVDCGSMADYLSYIKWDRFCFISHRRKAKY